MATPFASHSLTVASATETHPGFVNVDSLNDTNTEPPLKFEFKNYKEKVIASNINIRSKRIAKAALAVRGKATGIRKIRAPKDNNGPLVYEQIFQALHISRAAI